MARHEQYKIAKSFDFQGRHYAVGSEEQLYRRISQRQFDQLVQEGKLVPIAKQEAGSTPPPTDGLKPKTLSLLEAAGVTSDETTAMSDEELIALDGIGEATVKEIRAVCGEYSPAE